MLLTCVTIVANAFGVDYTVPSKKVEPKKDEPKKVESKKDESRMPEHAKANMKFKISGKNQEMKIKAQAGIKKDLSESEKNTEKTKLKTTNNTKFLTKSEGTPKKKVGVSFMQTPNH
jgi:hypothetical protein